MTKLNIMFNGEKPVKKNSGFFNFLWQKKLLNGYFYGIITKQ